MAEMKIGEKTQGPIQGQLHSDGAHNELDRVEGELKKKDPAIVTAQASTSAPEAPAAATQTPYPMDNKSFDFEFWKESERGFKPETKLDKFLSNPSPENLKGATQEVFDPNGDGKVSLQEAKEYVGKIKAMGTASVTALSKMSNEELQDIIKREGSDGKELASSMKKSGLEISQEAALEIQKGLVGIAKEALATKKASNLDLDGNKEVDKAEAEKSADSLKVAVSKFPLQAKQAILKNDEILSKEDPTGQKEADEYTKNTGIKMTAEAALVIREAKKAGAASANPDPELAEKEKAEKEKQAKGGKGFGGFIEMIIGFLSALLGIDIGGKKEETEVAAKQNTPAAEKKDEKKNEPEMTTEQKAKSNEIIAGLSQDFQNAIKNAGKDLSGGGVLLSGNLETARTQIVGSKQPERNQPVTI